MGQFFEVFFASSLESHVSEYNVLAARWRRILIPFIDTYVGLKLLTEEEANDFKYAHMRIHHI